MTIKSVGLGAMLIGAAVAISAPAVAYQPEFGEDACSHEFSLVGGGVHSEQGDPVQGAARACVIVGLGVGEPGTQSCGGGFERPGILITTDDGGVYGLCLHQTFFP